MTSKYHPRGWDCVPAWLLDCCPLPISPLHLSLSLCLYALSLKDLTNHVVETFLQKPLHCDS